MNFEEMPQVQAWASDVGTVNLKTFLLANVSVSEAFSLAEILYPAFVEYEGCVILGFAFDETGVRSWLDHFKGNRKSVEAMVNHLHLWDVFAAGSDVENAALSDLASRIGQVWENMARSRFPGREFVAEVSDGSDDYGPTVSLHSVQ